MDRIDYQLQYMRDHQRLSKGAKRRPEITAAAKGTRCGPGHYGRNVSRYSFKRQ